MPAPAPNIDAPAANDTASFSLRAPRSAIRASLVLVVLSFQRHWRVRQMGWVALGLLGITTIWVAVVTASPAGWGLENRRVRRTQITYREYGELLRPKARYDALEEPPEKLPAHPGRPPRVPSPFETPAPLNPLHDSLTSLVLSIPHAVLSSETFLKDWAFTNFSRAAVLGAYLSFVLPLFTLAYATAAVGGERESRSLVWLTTRPLPRSAIYLAKFLGTLPWCLLFSAGGFAAICLAGGQLGREAFRIYWPAALAGTVALSALFHLIGAIFRRPVIVGLVYVFFFEFLVASLPGSLKLLSLTFYVRSLMYNGAAAAGYPGEMLNVAQPVSSETAWAVLAAVSVGLTGLGMWRFARTEYRDDT